MIRVHVEMSTDVTHPLADYAGIHPREQTAGLAGYPQKRIMGKMRLSPETKTQLSM